MLIESGYGISAVQKHQHHFASSKVKFFELKEEECYVDVVLLWRKDNDNPNISRTLDFFENLNFLS